MEYKEDSLDSLRGLSGLVTLKVSDNRKVTETGFLEDLPNLNSLEFAHYRALTSLEGLRTRSGLHTLKISGTRKLASLDAIGELAGLETLELMGLGPVPSLQFLSACKNLRVVVLMDTEIKDGKLDFLDGMAKLEKVIFENKRHYNRKREDFRKPIPISEALNQEILSDNIKKRLNRP
jgi:hypothetical protein